MNRKVPTIQAFCYCLLLVQTCRTPLAAEPVKRLAKGIWTSREELSKLPMTGPAFQHLKDFADRPAGIPDLKNQDQNNDVLVLAKALMFGRTGDQKYRRVVIDNCLKAIGTERDGRTLALGRNLAPYVIAADLVELESEQDGRFRQWLRDVLTEELDGRTLVSTHEDRPNNWGTHAGAARAAVAVYLNDFAELERAAMVFKGYLGDRSSYASFNYGDLSWQADAKAPVGINPKGATREGHSIDGVMPDDMRRGTEFQWPPKRTNYPWEALQGALVQAEILHRAGYKSWEWEDRALLRAVSFLYELKWDPEGDDQWTPWLINYRYGTNFPTRCPVRFGKSMGWTDWTHSGTAPSSEKN